MRLQRLLIGILALAIGTLASCSKKDDNRFRISGSVAYDNKPMPYGEVLFTPDGANPGPQGIAYIRDGKYDTSQSNGKGYAGGPTVVRVTGLSRPDGGVICEYEYSVDLPRGETKHDIVVPEKEIRKGPSKEI
jgi:hypothetical protein